MDLLETRIRAAMPKKHKVKDGDCLLSIAAATGVPWQSIWGFPDNAGLRARRRQPTILAPGDIVYIPDLNTGEYNEATDNRHRFKREVVNAELRLRLLYDGKPLNNVKYRITVGDRTLEGQTSSDGEITETIPASAASARLRIANHKDVRVLKLGWLDPDDSAAGVQARLNNLGHPCGGVDGKFGKLSREGMNGFQDRHGIAKTRNPNQETVQKLEQEHGC